MLPGPPNVEAQNTAPRLGAASRDALDQEAACTSDHGGCVTFDPPAGRPGRLVTIVPAPPDKVLPIIGGECPPGAELELQFFGDNKAVGVPLEGTYERATFRVPSIPPGSYVVGVYCPEVNLGFDLDPPFVVLGLPATSSDPADLVSRHALPSNGAILAALSAAFGIGFGLVAGRLWRRRR